MPLFGQLCDVGVFGVLREDKVVAEGPAAARRSLWYECDISLERSFDKAPFNFLKK